MGCNCGSRKKTGSKTWQHVDSTGKVINTYASEYEARTAAARQAGTRVRPA